MRKRLLRSLIVAGWLAVGLAGCAAQPGNGSLVRRMAPSVADFRFDDSPPLAQASDFAPWAELLAENASQQSEFESCLNDRDRCETGNLLRYRRLLELAADLPREGQLKLVQEYFNTVEQIDAAPSSELDVWATLYRVASSHQADCKGIALAKYFTLRRLGWSAEDLRVVMNWDDREYDWHAVLAVRHDDETFVLDSILGLQRPRAFGYSYLVYSISENGIWDHAPDFVPVP